MSLSTGWHHSLLGSELAKQIKTPVELGWLLSSCLGPMADKSKGKESQTNNDKQWQLVALQEVNIKVLPVYLCVEEQGRK